MSWKNKKLRVRNWCQHRDTTVTFDDYSNGVVGPNGYGKSNLIKGIRFLLSGECDGTLQANVRDGEIKCTLELDAIVNGSLPVKLKRIINTDVLRTKVTSQTFKMTLGEGDSKEVISGITPIKERINLLLGVPISMLSKYVFVGQKELDALMSTKASTRLDGFISMLPGGVHASENRRNRVRDEMNKYPEKINPFDDSEMQLQLGFNKTNLVNKQVDLAAAKLELDELDGINYRGALAKHQASLVYEAQVLTVTASIAAAEASNLAASGKHVVAEASVTALNAHLALHDEDLCTEYSALLTTYARYDAAGHQRLQHELGIQEAALLALVTPVGEPDGFNTGITVLMDAIRDTSQQRVALQTKQDIANRIAQTGSAACPTCGSVVGEVEDVVAELAAKDVILTQLNTQLTTLRAGVDEHTRFNQQRSGLEYSIKMTTDALSNVAVPQHTEDEQTSMRDYIQRRADVLADVLRETYSCQLLKQKAASEEHTLGVLRETLRTAQAAAMNVLPKVMVMQYEDMARVSDLRTADVLALTAESAALETQISNILVNIESSKLMEQERAVNKRYRSILQKVYEGLHREAFPKRVLQHYLAEFRTQIDSIMEKFDNPFTVEVTDDLEFFCTMPDGYRCPGSRLSGGEEGVFSVAMRLAIANLFCSGVGFICIDEPSQNMDDDNVRLLSELVKKLHDISTNSDLQIILITHHLEHMAGCFNNLIDVSKEKDNGRR